MYVNIQFSMVLERHGTVLCYFSPDQTYCILYVAFGNEKPKGDLPQGLGTEQAHWKF